MTDLLNKLTYLITQYLLPLIFPGYANVPARSIYYWIFRQPLVLLFALVPFVFYIVRLFRRILKNE